MPTGNTPNSIGPVDTSISGVPLGNTVTLDVVVSGVPAPTGLYGVGFELGYNPAVVHVTGKDMASSPAHVMQFSQGSPAPIVNTTDSLPDADGHFRVDSVGGDVQETGSGRVATIVLQCVDVWTSALTLTDASTGGDDNAGVLYISGAGHHYTVDQEFEASIGCGEALTPTPAGGTPTPTPRATAGSPTPIGTTPGQTLVWGDSDCDGEITTRDSQAVLRSVLSQEALSQTEPCADLGVSIGTHTWGDWDCDMAISTRDSQLLLRVTLSQPALSQLEPCPDPGDAVQVAA